METLNINAVEMVNNTVKLNNTVMGNIEELDRKSTRLNSSH